MDKLNNVLDNLNKLKQQNPSIDVNDIIDELKDIINPPRYDLPACRFAAHLDRYTLDVINIKRYVDPHSFDFIEYGESLIKNDSNGGFIKYKDALDLYQLGYNDAKNETLDKLTNILN